MMVLNSCILWSGSCQTKQEAEKLAKKVAESREVLQASWRGRQSYQDNPRQTWRYLYLYKGTLLLHAHTSTGKETFAEIVSPPLSI